MSTAAAHSARTDVRRHRRSAERDPAAQADGLAALIMVTQLLTPDSNRIPSPARGSGIAVIIPARDEGAALGDTLRSMAGQTLRPDRIVVVVNNSTDDTAEAALSYAAARGSVATDVLEMRGFNQIGRAHV